MLSFKYEHQVGDGYNRIIVWRDGELIDIAERKDDRSSYISKISLASFVLPIYHRRGWLSFDDPSVDRFLFT